MPRKPKPVTALGAKASGRPKMTRKNAPGRVADRTPSATGDASKPICEFYTVTVSAGGKETRTRCKQRSVEYRRFRWYCATHDPGNIPDPNCLHELTSPLWEREVCSMCGFVLLEESG